VTVFAVLGDPAANSGSDAGAKLATAASMAEHGFNGGDLGYWAEGADPEGDHRAFTFGVHTSRGWVHATGAIMPLLAALGWLIGGPLGALWPAVISVPLGALAAARLARGLGAPTGSVAFWVIGAASPLTFYGLDHWEHAPALAASLWAIALLRDRPVGWAVIRLGVIAGLAVVLRRETAIMLSAVGLLTIFEADERRFWLGQVRVAVAGVAAAGATLLAADWLDGRVLGRTLAGKARAQLGEASGLSIDGDSDVLLTTISQYTNTEMIYVALSVASIVGATVAARGWRDRDAVPAVLGSFVLLGGLVVRWFVAGLAFAPGAFAVLPVIGAVPVVARSAGRRLALVALVSTVVTLAIQDVGALGAQWGGRYLLLPAAVLAVVALAGIERLAAARSAESDPLRLVPVVLVASTVLFGSLGIAWHIDRTNQVGESRDEVLAVVGDDVVISTHAHFPREIAVDVGDRPWLLADDDIDAAISVAREAVPGSPIWLLEPVSCPDGVCVDLPVGAVTTSRLGPDSARFLLTPIDP